jgi:hypothetical protein
MVHFDCLELDSLRDSPQIQASNFSQQAHGRGPRRSLFWGQYQTERMNKKRAVGIADGS